MFLTTTRLNKIENQKKGEMTMNRNKTVKFAVIAAALVCISMSRVYAIATANFSAAGDTYFANSSGTYLLDGNLVEVGRFSISDGTISAMVSGGEVSQANYSTLMASFIPLDTVFSSAIGVGTTAGASSDNSGAISKAFTGGNATFAGLSMYVMVFNTSTTGTATQVGVFTGPTWLFPGNMVSGAVAYDAGTAGTPLIGTITTGRPGTGNDYNTVIGDGLDPIRSLNLVNITAIPEPSSIALVGIGMLGLVGFIRRRRS
jgi:hypothetical protein